MVLQLALVFLFFEEICLYLTRQSVGLPTRTVTAARVILFFYPDLSRNYTALPSFICRNDILQLFR